VKPLRNPRRSIVICRHEEGKDGKKKSGALGRVASKTVAAGRVHVATVLLGEETLPEAAGGTVEDVISGSKVKPASRTAKKVSVKAAEPHARKKPTIKRSAARRKSQAK
jgi:hypothetical protein